MKIAIDMQPCQTDSRHRGIGRYVLELVRALTRSRRDIDPILLVDGCDTLKMREARKRLRESEVNSSPLSFHYPVARGSGGAGTATLRHAAGLLRARQLEALQPDAVLVTSFFEGFHGGSGVESDLDIDVLSGAVTVAVTYDLIPLIFPEHYLPEGAEYTWWYRKKLERFKQFDLYLAISEATKDDLVKLLGIDSERVRVIGAGYRDQSQDDVAPRDVDLSKLGIHSSFVLMVGNGDWRKNNIGAVEIFARLPSALREKHQLVLTQSGADVHQTLSGKYAAIRDRTVLLGQVDDTLLSALYRRCAVFIFPSRYEGFGLPIIEAMAHGAPVISSNAGSLPEVVFDREALFDPDDLGAAARLLARVLVDSSFREKLARLGPGHAARFSWERCADLALDAIVEAVERKRDSVESPVHVGDLDSNLPANAWLPSEPEIGLLAEVLHTLGPVAQPPIENALASVLKGRRRRILVDVTCVVTTEAWTGIQRVVRNYCIGLASLARRNPEFDVHLISANAEGLRYANDFGIERLGLSLESASGPVQVLPDDVLFLLDSTWEWPERFDALVDTVWRNGGEVVRMVYDLVPVRFPHTCHPGMPPVFGHWLEHAIKRTDGVICISEAVRRDLEDYMDEMGSRGEFQFRPWTQAVHLGNDLESGDTDAPSEAVRKLLGAAEGHDLLFAVGTVEPRKDHATILAAFDELWEGGADPFLVIVGKEGWNVEELAARLREHPFAGRRLFWLERASDGDIAAIIERADALIQASISEGFGLPIVEAGSKGVPLLLSDIPVFHEIAGDQASYFPVGDAGALAKLIRHHVANGEWVRPEGIRTLTWAESSLELAGHLLAPAVLRKGSPA